MFSAAGMAAEASEALGNVLDKILGATGVEDVWTAFTDSLASTVAKETAKSVQDLMEFMADPANKTTIDAFAGAISDVTKNALTLTGTLTTLTGWLTSTETGAKAFQTALEYCLTPLNLVIAAIDKLTAKGYDWEGKIKEFWTAWDKFWADFWASWAAGLTTGASW